MLPSFICHFPSGSSSRQFIHYALEVKFGFFGKYGTNLTCPQDFPLSNIEIPISLHYSTGDIIADAEDVEILIPKLKNVIFTQRIDAAFNHLDFVWSPNSVSLVYSKILDLFQSN